MTGAGAVRDGDSETGTIGDLGIIRPNKPESNIPRSSQTAGVMAWLKQGWWRASRQKTFASSTAVVAPDRSEDRSVQAVSSFGASPVTSFVRVRPWPIGWRQKWSENIASGQTRGIACKGAGLESVANSGTESSTKANVPTALGSTSLGHARFLPGNIFSVATESITESASEGRGWRRRVGGGKSMGRYSVPHWHKMALCSRKHSQV